MYILIPYSPVGDELRRVNDEELGVIIGEVLVRGEALVSSDGLRLDNDC